MLPSKILFKHGTNALVPELAQEYQFGLYFLTKTGKDTKKEFNTTAEAQKAKLHVTDLFLLKSKNRKTTIGQELINATIPTKYRVYGKAFDKKVVSSILTTIAKEAPNDFPGVIDSFKDLGHKYAFTRSSTISLSDFTEDRSYRDDIVKEYQAKVNATSSKSKRTELWLEAQEKVKKAQDKKYKGKNNIYEWLESGGLSGSKAPNVTQILSMPGLVADIKGTAMENPVLRSFGEGLDAADYWKTMYGVRKGVVDVAVSTSGPGALSKALLGNVWDTLIIEEDCKTTTSIDFDVEGNEKDIIDRCLAEDIPGVGSRNTIIDMHVYNSLKSKKIKNVKVRSPLTCKTHNGLCQRCYGVLPTGKFPEIGYNAGLGDAQAITEKSTQLILRTKHTGAAFAGGKADQSMMQGFDRLVQLLEVPTVVSGKATLAPLSGTIKRIKPTAVGG